jgi:hypothetical protein
MSHGQQEKEAWRVHVLHRDISSSFMNYSSRQEFVQHLEFNDLFDEGELKLLASILENMDF